MKPKKSLTSKSSKFKLQSKGNKLVLLVVSVLVVIVLAILAQKTLIAKDRAEVSILVAGTDSILASNTQISDKNTKWKVIDKLLLEPDMITKENVEEFKDFWTTLPLRHGSPVYKDLLAKESAKETGWIYSIPKDGVGISIPFNYLDAGGKTIRPGDRLIIHNSVKVENADGSQMVKSSEIFPEARIADMLNSEGNSIKEIYKETLKLTTSERDTKIKSKEFLSSIQPVRLIIITDRVGSAKWAEAKASGSVNLSLAVLSRDFVLDKALEDVELQIQKWNGGGK